MNSHLRSMVDKSIAGSDQHLFAIFDPEGHESCFVYTIGNALRGLPELLVIGNFDPQIMGAMLNEVGYRMRKAEQAPLEGLLDIGWSVPVKVRKCGDEAKTKFTIQAGEYLGRQDYDVLQIMVPDKNGKYPGDVGVNKLFDVETP